MNQRCQGAKTPGHFTSFECRLDDGHDGYCEPYIAPTVDQWRLLRARVARLESELDAAVALLDAGSSS